AGREHAAGSAARERASKHRAFVIEPLQENQPSAFAESRPTIGAAIGSRNRRLAARRAVARIYSPPGGAHLSHRGTLTPRLETVLGQPSWSFSTSLVRASLTRRGGHLAPVTFTLKSGETVEPYAVAPWAEGKLPPGVPDLLRSLRGDFFCCPFGGNGVPWRGERHPPHGETANGSWRLVSLERVQGRATLHARMQTRARKGRVDKFLTLIDGHAVVYSSHVLSGLHGPMSLGHHALLKF